MYPASQPEGRKRTRSGCNIEVSRRDRDDFAGQIRDAVRFLRKHTAAVRRLRAFPGVDEACLDFGVDKKDAIVYWEHFPEELIVLAGRCRLSLELTHYPPLQSKRKTKKLQQASKVGGRTSTHNMQARKVRKSVKKVSR